MFTRCTKKSPHPPHRTTRGGFTLMELLTVMAIIAILAALTLPAIKSLTKSNDASQATNLVRSLIDTARSVAISQHRMAGVVFFEETSTYSRPANSAQTAMQLFVEDYNQASYANPNATYFIYYTTARQYLPAGIKLATLSDSGIATNDNTNTTQQTRAVLFDANGQLLLRGLLAAPNPVITIPGTYPQAYGDWKFGGAPNITNAFSSPGFFLYNKNDYDAAYGAGLIGTDPLRAQWLQRNADVIIINGNTGNVIGK